ncbi:phenol hydroxylase subunit [Pseudohalioglobus lutimaris]|uniref:Phenol hydroxylase n=1 Tax=Pseudohalioglobus lutimaris TaxID=1737061 RepID=A0A2N5WXP1_9GAMM|nr:phenol hydroxylase subunit [Pseudohalioglobus lutimaris]PLW67002.1 phenol hydroxylase [Pseudohalioglobus lutimaris]
MASESNTRSNTGAGNFAELKRYVRVRQVIDDKFVEFDFAIGDPSLYVELVLPKAAFDAFCRHNKVEIMTEEQAAAVDADMEKWRYGEEKPTS